jgi:hypothetical protein
MKKRSGSGQRPKAFKKQLDEISKEASRSADDIRFLMESSGQPLSSELNYSIESLDEVEWRYRELARSPDRMMPGFSLGDLERLLSLYLGEVLLRLYGGEWSVYHGRFRTFSPFVVRIGPEQKAVDVFLIADHLHQKTNMMGARSGSALRKYAEQAPRSAFD